MERARVHTGFQLFSICKERATQGRILGCHGSDRALDGQRMVWRLVRHSLNQLKSLPAKVGDKTSADIRAIQCRLPRVNRAPLCPVRGCLRVICGFDNVVMRFRQQFDL